MELIIIFKPRLIFWELTEKCNLRCIHCRACVSNSHSPCELSAEEVRRVIEDLKDFERPVLVFTGGEPLYRNDIFDIINYSVNAGFPVALATNGTLIDEKMAEKIVSSGVRRVSISIDGARDDTHDSFRGIAGSFNKAIEGFDRLKQLGMSLQFNTTVARHNIKELPLIFDFALKKGADALHIFLLVPVGCGVEISKDQQITAEEYEDILNWFYEKSQNSPMELKATCAPHYFRVMAQKGKGKNTAGTQSKVMHTMTKGCLLGTGIVFISFKGDVRPCGYLPLNLGNVKVRHIKDIWEKSDILNDFRDSHKLKGKCGLCEFKHICMGCRARAFGETGDYLGAEPFCSYIPQNFGRKK